MKKIKGPFWYPVPPPPPSNPSVPSHQTRALRALAVKFGALDPEGSLSGSERH